jgi:molybdenum cofactor biosynthesis enzyme MoaA
MSECSKISYVSRRTAVRAMRAIARSYANRGLVGPKGAYFCTSCRRWHLTSKTGVQTPPWDKVRAER